MTNFRMPLNGSYSAAAQSNNASASASLSSFGLKPHLRTAASTSSLPALPLPVACFLIVPTGTA